MFQAFTSTRMTQPDPMGLISTVRTALADATALVIDQNAGLATSGGLVFVQKATSWTPGDLTAAQTAIDTAPALTPQREAQNEIDNWPITVRALALALLDQINVLRAALPTPLVAITPAQAMAAIRTKAGTLS